MRRGVPRGPGPRQGVRDPVEVRRRRGEDGLGQGGQGHLLGCLHTQVKSKHMYTPLKDGKTAIFLPAAKPAGKETAVLSSFPKIIGNQR